MGRRIINSAAAAKAIGQPREGIAREAPSGAGQYWDRLKNLIPAEVSAIYIAGQGVIPAGEQLGLSLWAAFCLLCTAAFIAKESTAQEGNPGVKYPVDWIHVAISSVSFVVWVYALGGPFVAWGLHVPWVGALIIIGWTFIVPYFYKGTKASLHP